jgi:N utilization substance protein B
MLSRRSIRIKIMQVLYAMSRDEALERKGATDAYRKKINQSFELYLFALRYFMRIAAYARQDGEIKKSKYRPSDADLSFKTRLIDHPIMATLSDNEGLFRLFHQYQLEAKIDKDTVRSIYTEFARQEDYSLYVIKQEVTDEEQREILLSLLKSCFNNDLFVETLEDYYPNFSDDKSLIVGALKKNIKALPLKRDFYEQYRPTKETTEEFGQALLEQVQDKDGELMSIIEPVLKNWDADRVAVIDLILLKMAVCELLDFPSIPTKVTLNEFVEISKLYSTDKSKDFINGILDRLMKQLTDEGRINKRGRGLIG